MNALERSYRRLVRWYPREWRARNERVVLSALLDQAEAEQRDTLRASDAFSLVAGGLNERFLRSERPSAPQVAALGLAAGFAIWYVAIIAGRYDTAASATGIVLFLALLAAVSQRVRLARLIAALSALCSLITLALSLSFGWMGPGVAATALFIGFSAIGSIRLQQWRQLITAVASVLLIAVSMTSVQIAVMTWPVVLAPQFWIWGTNGLAAGTAALLLMAAFYAQQRRLAHP